MTARRFVNRLVQQPSARVLTVLLALVLSAIAPRLYAQVRIGVVDIRRAISETNEGRSSYGAIKTRFDAHQSEIDQRTRALEAMKRRFDKAARHVTPQNAAQLQKMQGQMQKNYVELQQIGQQYSQEIEALQAAMAKQILTKMQPILREIGTSENFQIIVDEQVVYFSPAQLDLTDRVIQSYNQRNPVPDGGVVLPQLPAEGEGGPPGMGGMGPPPGGGPGGGGGEDIPPPAMAGDDGGVMLGGSTEPPPGPGASDAGGGGRRGLPGVFFSGDGGR